MKNLLHIVATPRTEESRTLKVSGVFIDQMKNKYPAAQIDTLDLSIENLPSLTTKRLDGKYVLLSGGELTGELKDAWKEIIFHIERFLLADSYLISTPMWNFSIPYILKHYIDVILQPKYLFRYTETGPEGLVKNKKMLIVTSRGGDYSSGSPFHQYDFQEPYLRAIFGLVGITDMHFINTQPMDALGPEVQKEKIEEAKKVANKIVDQF